MVRMRRGDCNKSKPLSLFTVDVSVYPSCHAESCHVTIQRSEEHAKKLQPSV